MVVQGGGEGGEGGLLVWVEEKVRGYKGERLGGKESSRSSSLADCG